VVPQLPLLICSEHPYSLGLSLSQAVWPQFFIFLLEQEILKLPTYLGATSDIWSAHHKSFIAVTIHWFDPETKARFNCLLTLRRFKFNHTYNRIAKRLYKILSDFGILEKTFSMTTDGG
jgi:hypothetical protein